MKKEDIEAIKEIEKTNRDDIFVITTGNGKKSLCNCVVDNGVPKSADFLCDFLYDEIETYIQYNGLIIVSKGELFNRFYGLINDRGREIVPCSYKNLSHFDEKTGLSCVSKNGKDFGFINRLGTFVIPLVYENPLWYESDEKGLFWLKNQYGKWGALDEGGYERIPFVYDDTNRIYNGSACVAKNGKFGFIDEFGKTLIEFKFPYEDIASLTHFERYDGTMYAIITESWHPIRQYLINSKGDRISKVYNGIHKYVQNEQGERFAQRNGGIYLIDGFGNEQFVEYGSL